MRRELRFTLTRPLQSLLQPLSFRQRNFSVVLAAGTCKWSVTEGL